MSFSAPRTFWVLAGLHAVLAAATLPYLLGPGLHGGQLIGDEAAYVDGARALSNAVRDAVRLHAFDTGELQRSVVGSGWFMPGMSILLTPLFIVAPAASVMLIRCYLSVVSTALLVGVAWRIRGLLGAPYGTALLVIPGLVPMWVIFAAGAWGDLSAGLVLALLIAETAMIGRAALSGTGPTGPTWRDGVRVGALAITMVYLRSSTSLIAAAFVGLLGLAVVVGLRGRDRRRGLVSAALAAAVVVAVLAPWSLAASATLGGPVITTTSVPTVRAVTFGDYRELCFGPCDPGSTVWFNPLRYSREVARTTGLSELEVQQQMSAYARREDTTGSYLRDVWHNTVRYSTDPAQFAHLIRPPSVVAALGDTLVAWGTRLLFYPALLAGVLVLLIWRRGSPADQALPVLIKVGLAGLLVQPFVHLAGSRYWTTAAPVVALGVVWLVLGRRSGEDVDVDVVPVLEDRPVA